MPIHSERAERAIKEKISEKVGLNTNEAAQSMIRIVNHNMSRAISIVSVERGRDPRDYTLVAFGGAGPIHACDLAEEIAIKRIIVPEHPGLFSAYGLLTVDLARMFSIPVLTTDLELGSYFHQLKEEAKRALEKEGFPNPSFLEHVDLRYKGQSYEITIPHTDAATMRRNFDAKHKEFYGYASTDEEVEVVNAKVRAVVSIPKAERKVADSSNLLEKSIPKKDQERKAWISGNYSLVPIYSREKLILGDSGIGPCIIEEYDSTTIVNSNWSWNINEFRDIDIRKE